VLVAVTPCDRAAGASSSAAPGAAAGATSSAAPGAAAGATSYDVRLYPRIDHRLSEDIAKQILTMLSTILTAMIGFYFGAKQGSTEDDRIGGKPRDARSGAPEPGLSAAEREAAAKSIDEQLANAPDTDDLQTRATQLAGRENLPETARNEAKGFQDELPDLKKAIDTARATRTADATTAAQMQNAAASAKTAVERLQSIAQRIVALEQTAS
jgi:hypothetical protein